VQTGLRAVGPADVRRAIDVGGVTHDNRHVVFGQRRQRADRARQRAARDGRAPGTVHRVAHVGRRRHTHRVRQASLLVVIFTFDADERYEIMHLNVLQKMYDLQFLVILLLVLRLLTNFMGCKDGTNT